MSYEEFRKNILTGKSKKHKATNSLGVYDAYKWIRKNKWLDIERPITEHEFYSIIRSMNEAMADYFLNKGEITFPERMGKLEIRKYEASIEVDKKGKIKTNLPIDWDRTLKLWYEDEEAHKKKTLVKMEEKEIFKVYYDRKTANYTNKSMYEFRVNQHLKRRLKQRIKEGLIDSYTMSRL